VSTAFSSPLLVCSHPQNSEFAATRTALNSDSASDVLSVLSAGTGSIPNSSAPISASHVNGRSRARLSPVSEGEKSSDSRSRPRMLDSLAGMSFEMVTPAPSTKQEARKLDGSSRTKNHHPSHITSPSMSMPSSDLSFARRKVTPLKPLKSSLSAMLASSDASSNPFAELYAAISGRGESAATNVQVFFPHAKQQTGKAMDLNVRMDATVEEVIGFALWTYWKEGWLPKLTDGLSGEDDPRWETKLSAVGWIVRIAEEDGEVDDDFPRKSFATLQNGLTNFALAPDRLGRISKFNADAYAVLEATLAQSATS
jgi:target of rapamycin complex 2 subunit MAPKAP1